MIRYRGACLPNIWLENGYIEKETPYGEAVAVEDVQGLYSAIDKEMKRLGGESKKRLVFEKTEEGWIPKAA